MCSLPVSLSLCLSLSLCVGEWVGGWVYQCVIAYLAESIRVLMCINVRLCLSLTLCRCVVTLCRDEKQVGKKDLRKVMVCQAPINLSDGDVIGQIIQRNASRVHAHASQNQSGAAPFAGRCGYILHILTYMNMHTHTNTHIHTHTYM